MSAQLATGDKERRAAAKRNAVVLAVVAGVIYAGYIVWNLLRDTS